MIEGHVYKHPEDGDVVRCLRVFVTSDMVTNPERKYEVIVLEDPNNYYHRTKEILTGGYDPVDEFVMLKGYDSQLYKVVNT